jgi:hypothetical protein
VLNTGISVLVVTSVVLFINREVLFAQRLTLRVPTVTCHELPGHNPFGGYLGERPGQAQLLARGPRVILLIATSIMRKLPLLANSQPGSGGQNDAVTVALNGDVSAIELYIGEITISGD